MENINRRKFILTGAVGLAGAATITCATPLKNDAVIDKVKLGDTGLVVPRLAMGTGSYGFKKQSKQTKLGMEIFIENAQYAYDRGIHFFDTADSYGSHTFVREAIKNLPREKLTILSKIWTTDNSWNKTEPVKKTLDRFRTEVGTDYFDIMLLHCMLIPDWQEQKKEFIDGLSEAKEKGIVKKVGVSCHNFKALELAVQDPWVDIILARINYDGAKMDGSPENVMPLLETARKNGKGVIGMKIFGAGDLIDKNKRQKSLEYVMGSKNVHCMTIGFENTNQIDDAINRIMALS